jgi:hypothetical protein
MAESRDEVLSIGRGVRGRRGRRSEVVRDHREPFEARQRRSDARTLEAGGALEVEHVTMGESRIETY